MGWLDMPGLEAAYGILLGERCGNPCLSNGAGGSCRTDGAFIVLNARRAVLAGEPSQLLLDYLKRALEA